MNDIDERIEKREDAQALFDEAADLFAQHLTPAAIVDAKRVVRILYDMNLGSAQAHDVIMRLIAGDIEGAKKEASLEG